MKKQLIGLTLAAMLTAGMSSCSLTKAKVEEPTRKGNTYVVKTTDVLDLTDALKAAENTIDKLSKGLKKATLTARQKELIGNYYEYGNGKGSVELYANDAFVSEFKLTSGAILDGVDIVYNTFSINQRAAIKDGVTYIFMEEKTSDSTEASFRLTPGQGDIGDVLGFESALYAPGFFGKLENGNGVYYSISVGESSMSGYDKDGNIATIRTVEYDENLLLYSGDCITGDPVAHYDYRHIIAYCDENKVISTDSIVLLEDETVTKFEYGKRKTLEKADEFISSIEKHPVISELNNYNVYSAEATLSADGSTFDYIGSGYLDYGLAGGFVSMSDYGSKANGYINDTYVPFEQGHAYRIDTDIDIEILERSSEGTPSQSKLDDYSNFNKIKLQSGVNLPSELKLVEYAGVNYIYALEDCAYRIVAETKTETELTMMGPIVSNELTITKIAPAVAIVS